MWYHFSLRPPILPLCLISYLNSPLPAVSWDRVSDFCIISDTLFFPNILFESWYCFSTSELKYPLSIQSFDSGVEFCSFMCSSCTCTSFCREKNHNYVITNPYTYLFIKNGTLDFANEIKTIDHKGWFFQGFIFIQRPMYSVNLITIL